MPSLRRLWRAHLAAVAALAMVLSGSPGATAAPALQTSDAGAHFGIQVDDTCRMGSCPPSPAPHRTNMRTPVAFSITTENGDQFEVKGSDQQINGVGCSYAGRAGLSIQFTGNGSPVASGADPPVTGADTFKLDIFHGFVCAAPNVKQVGTTYGLTGNFSRDVAAGSSVSVTAAGTPPLSGGPFVKAFSSGGRTATDVNGGAFQTHTTFTVNFAAGSRLGSYIVLNSARAPTPITTAEVRGVHFAGTAQPVLRDVACVAGMDCWSTYETLPQPEKVDATDPCQIHRYLAPVYEWQQCGPKPSKVWPIIVPFTPATPPTLVIGEVAIEVQSGTAQGLRITGQADVGGLKFQGTLTQYGNFAYAENLKPVSGSLPWVVKHLPITITWSIENQAGEDLVIGTSTHPIYVVARFFGSPRREAQTYLSIVDMTTSAADGFADPDRILWAIWSRIQDRNLTRAELDPSNGDVKAGAPLTYWYEWDEMQQWNENFAIPRTCHAQRTRSVLSARLATSTCEDWGSFMVDALASQGLSAEDVPLTDFEVFKNPPNGAADLQMLVGHWEFSATPSGDDEFPYVNIHDFAHADEVSYFGVKAQGHMTCEPTSPSCGYYSPPGFFPWGGHDIVRYNGQLFDPSYGTGPFDDITMWMRSSLAGYATRRCPDGVSGVPCLRAQRLWQDPAP